MEEDDFFQDPVMQSAASNKDKSTQKYLRICKFFTVDIYDLKCVKFLFFLATSSLTSSCLFQTILFLKKFEINYFAQYGPFYFLSLYALVCFLCQPYTTKIVTSNIENVQVCSVEDAPQSIKEKLRKTDLWISGYVISAVLTSVIYAIGFSIPTKEDEDLIYYYKLVEMYFPSWKSFFSVVYRLTLLPLALITVASPAFNIVYYHGIISGQISMLKHSLEKLNVNYERLKHIYSSDSKYHRQITRRFNFLIKYYIQVHSNGLKAVKQTEKFVFLYQNFCLLALISILGFCFSGSFSSQLLRILALVLVAFVVGTGLFISGQKIEDITEVLAEAFRNVEWYHWSQGNKKSYCICLLTVVRQFRIKYSENISLNHKLAMEVLRAFFSVASVMYQLQQKRLK